MMNQKRNIPLDLETIMPLLIWAWRKFRKESGPSDVLQTREFRRVVSCIQALQEGLENNKTLVKTDYFSDPEMLGAYLLYQWVVHYQQGMSLLTELPTTPRRVLDVCSGPGAFSFAALRHGANEVFATDQNLSALQLGAEVCGRYGLPVSVRQWNCLKHPLPITGKFDLIIVAHCLEELFPSENHGWPEKQKAFLEKMMRNLTPNGYLMVVDSSLIDTNRRILQLRDYFVEKGIPVQAPCVWKGNCPALQTKDSPCYAQREFEKPNLIKEFQRAASINLGSLKMSYIIFRNPEAGWPKLPERDLYRIISPPIETFQGKRYYMCGTDGKKNLGSHLNEHPPESRAFDFLRRGELISIGDGLVLNQSIDIIKETTVKIESPCGKPLPEEEYFW